MFVDLMVFDLPGTQGGVEHVDFSNALTDFMSDYYNLDVSVDEGVDEIAAILMRVREQFTESATQSLSLWSSEFELL